MLFRKCFEKSKWFDQLSFWKRIRYQILGADSQLADIMDKEQLLTPFLTDIFYQEVEVSDSMQTLFRGNCLASKVMSHCFRAFGSQYLKKLLTPHIESLMGTHDHPRRLSRQSGEMASSDLAADQPLSRKLDTATGIKMNIPNESYDGGNEDTSHEFYENNPPSELLSYEVDIKKLEASSDINENRENLLKLTKQILDSILSSADEFPPQLNSMCSCLRQVLYQKYPDPNTNLKAVGTVIFLRFINPAIVAPYEAGIIDRQPSPRILRGLMLVSKILQNIANNVEFSKEEHMLPFNNFVRDQFEPMRKWVSEISKT